MAAPSMNALAERFAPRDVGAIFIYTHEAHPGENYPHLTSFEQKYRHAQALRDVLGVTRPTCWMRWTGPVIAPTARCPT